MKELSKRQAEAFEFISSTLTATGQPPTLREIRDRLGIVSVGSTANLVQTLIRKGYLRQEKYRYRGIRLARPRSSRNLEAAQPISIPLIDTGTLRGALLSAENVQRYINFDVHLAGAKDAFFIQATDGSVRGIVPGDLLLVSGRSKLQRGDIVAHNIRGRIEIAAWPSRQEETGAEVLGKVIGLYRRFEA